ncbi:hypothetical protein [Syntrophotalea acetylenivorans]|nr:hypothetical protein [Syntrophotalea acetylenivorans]
MKGSELLEKIDLLIDQGNMTWESPGRNADLDIARFCSAVQGLVHEIYGADHPYLQKDTEGSKEQQNALGEGMSVLKSIRKEVEYSSQLGH